MFVCFGREYWWNNGDDCWFLLHWHHRMDTKLPLQKVLQRAKLLSKYHTIRITRSKARRLQYVILINISNFIIDMLNKTENAKNHQNNTKELNIYKKNKLTEMLVPILQAFFSPIFAKLKAN